MSKSKNRLSRRSKNKSSEKNKKPVKRSVNKHFRNKKRSVKKSSRKKKKKKVMKGGGGNVEIFKLTLNNMTLISMGPFKFTKVKVNYQQFPQFQQFQQFQKPQQFQQFQKYLQYLKYLQLQKYIQCNKCDNFTKKLYFLDYNYPILPNKKLSNLTDEWMNFCKTLKYYYFSTQTDMTRCYLSLCDTCSEQSASSFLSKFDKKPEISEPLKTLETPETSEPHATLTSQKTSNII